MSPRHHTETTVLRGRRLAAAQRLAERQAGVVHRSQLADLGLDRHRVRTQLANHRWTRAGRHTVVVEGRTPRGEGRWWWAVWESGSGAVLDGVTALQARGLTGFTQETIHVSLPARNAVHRLPGVRAHRPRLIGPVVRVGIPRVRPDVATVHAAQWAVSDRQAALLVCLPVQQRLVRASDLLASWANVSRSPRRELLDAVIRDVCDGAHSLGELDFAGLCRRHRLPAPTRQSVRRTANGRYRLDVEFESGLVVEIDGAHHGLGLNPVDDALRANEVTLGGSRVLRIPVLGLRLEPARFMAQVARALGEVSGGDMRSAAPTTRSA